VLTVKEKSRNLEPIVEAVEQVVAVPAWLEADHDNFTGRVLHSPSRDEIDTPVEEQLIIEFYSR
jgi:small subunit ribosomal protein S4